MWKLYATVAALLTSFVAFIGPSESAAQLPKGFYLDEGLSIGCLDGNFGLSLPVDDQAWKGILDQCRVKDSKLEWLRLKLHGEVNAEMLNEVETYVKLLASSKITGGRIDLRSSGGDVGIAMEIGEVIWKQGMSVWAFDDGCYSSCVLIYAAAVARFNFTHWPNGIGVHRPILTDGKIESRSTFLEKYGASFDAIGKYLTSFGVSLNLVELMRTTPSTTIRVLSDEELNDFGLGGRNVAEEELFRARLRGGCGQDYESRFLAARQMALKCPIPNISLDSEDVNQFNACQNSAWASVDSSKMQSCILPRTP